MVDIYVDGGTRGSVICLVDTIRQKKIVKFRRGEPTNNELEYLAIIYGLEYARKYYPRDQVTIYSDSMLAVKQVNHQWKINGENLAYLKSRVDKKKTKLVTIVWIPRERNLAGIHLEEQHDFL